tara:strand:+ start:152 stop:415 length:264 start_codon:yes stop_codon:yes gene_type:complete
MKLLELIEIIQQHHPDIGETVIIKALNRAQDDFSSKTEIIEAIAEDVLVKDKRWYDLDPNMLTIKKVEIDNISIKRLLNPPIEGDKT